MDFFVINRFYPSAKQQCGGGCGGERLGEGGRGWVRERERGNGAENSNK